MTIPAGLALALAVTGCGGSGGEAAADVMPEVVGLQLDVALSDIERAGFEDEVEVLGGGTFGVVDESNWKVCEQLPAAGATLTETPRVTVDRSCGEEEAAESTTTAAETTTSAAPPTTPAPAPELTLTAANSPELAAVLVEGDYCSDPIQAFAAYHGGRTIEFDGSIGAMNPHGSYDTRYDLLIHAGDFDPNSAQGPSFQFRDVGMADLGLSGPDIPDSIGPGDNLHVVAKVEGYEDSSCLFLLDPISTSVR